MQENMQNCIDCPEQFDFSKTGFRWQGYYYCDECWERQRNQNFEEIFSK